MVKIDVKRGHMGVGVKTKHPPTRIPPKRTC